MTRLKQALALLALVVIYAVVQFGSGPDQLPGSAPVDVPGPGETVSALALAVPTGPAVWTGEVQWISDGDTLVVDVVDNGGLDGLRAGQEVKIRLLRIDTPEVERQGQPQECWADEAEAALKLLAPPGSLLTLQYDQEPQDQYGRDLAHLWNEAGVWINGQLLMDGHARMATYRPNVAHDDRVRLLEQLAMERGAGLWGNCAA